MEAAPVSISRWVDKTTMGYLHNGILLGHKEEEKFTLCDNMDGPGEHYAKWSKPVRERQIPYDFTHMWNLKNKMNEQTKQKQTHRHREQTEGCRWEGDWGLVEKGEGIKKYTLVVMKQPWGCKVQHREYSQWHCNNYLWGQVGTGVTGGTFVNYIRV